MNVSYLWSICDTEFIVSVNRNLYRVSENKRDGSTTILSLNDKYMFKDLPTAIKALAPKDCKFLYEVFSLGDLYYLKPTDVSGATSMDLRVEPCKYIFKHWYIGTKKGYAYFLGVSPDFKVFCYHIRVKDALVKRKGKYYNISGNGNNILPKNVESRKYDDVGNIIYPPCMSEKYVDEILKVIPDILEVDYVSDDFYYDFKLD